MATFDLSKNWLIIAPPNAPAVKRAEEDLSRYIKLLAGRTDASVLIDASAIPKNAPVVILNNDSDNPEGRGFSWKLTEDRLEIKGQGEGGLCKGIYDFLSALGFKWPESSSSLKNKKKDNIDNEILPLWDDDNVYSIRTAKARNYPVNDGEGPFMGSYKRLVIPEKSQALQTQKKRAALMRWAIRNRFDAIVFPFDNLGNATEEAELHALVPEAGGWTISSLVPRKLFLFHRELFRMERGKYEKDVHFCPTNPETIAILRSESQKLFLSAHRIRIFHLWPEEGMEKSWCACPSCRAFSLADQYRMAVNAVGDALAELYDDRYISILEGPDEEWKIPLRPNVFRINPKGLARLQY